MKLRPIALTLTWLGVLFVGLAASGDAQSVRGVIVDASDRAVIGAVVILLDSSSQSVARTLAGASGEFRLAAPRDGAYRIRTLRIGFRPTETELLQLRSGQDLAQRITLSAVALVLDTVLVENRSACRRVDRDSASLVFAAWEQARAAITAAQLTSAGRSVRATTIEYDRALDATNGTIKSQRASAMTQYVRQPWRTLSQDSLRRVGYVVPAPDDFTTYYAPGLDVLLSPQFVEDHCFRLARASDPRELVLEFEPTVERRRVAEVKGTVWLDRASSELRRVAFGYANVSNNDEDHAGGEMRFARLDNGGWVISQWSIRMPVLERPAETRSFRGKQLPDAGLHVAEIQVTGGALGTVIAGRDTVWTPAPVTLTGVVLDSASRKPLADARVTLAGTVLSDVTDDRGRFAIHGVLPGEHPVEVRTPSLDSATAMYASRVIVADSATALEIRVPRARVRVARTALFTGTVLADSSKQPIAFAEVGVADASLTTVTNQTGAFRLAGIPPGTHHVVVRRLGYGPMEVDLPFRAGERVERSIYLPKIVTLDSVLVTEATLIRAMQSFENHRNLGLGHFITRDDLAKAEGRSILATLQQLPALRFAYGHGHSVWVISGRGGKSLDPRQFPRGDEQDVLNGAFRDCYSLVYVDGRRVYSGRQGEHLFDVNTVRPYQLEGVEYYASAAETPAEYSDLGSACGVLVLWTRRSP